MKKITFLLLLFTASLVSGQVVLENFEGTAPTISSTSTLVASISTDQAVDTKSLKIVTVASGDAWQQAELILQGETIDLRSTKTATAEVYSTTAFKMLAKVIAPIDASGTGAGPESATSAAHTGSGWETLTFDFSSPEDGTGAANDVYGKVLFLPNWEGTGSGTNGDNPNWNNSIAATYYVDNFSGVGYTAPAPSALTILEDFEGTAPTFSSTSTLVASISTDQAMGTNSLKIVTEASGDAWQLAELILQGETIDLRTTKTATAEVYSTTAFKMLAKVVAPIDASGTGAGPESATSAAHTGSGWETLTFDFASPEDGTGAANDVYGKVLFLPNWEGTGSGTNGDNPNWNNSIAATYYVDNFSGVGYTAPAPSALTILEDFEGTAPTFSTTSTLVASISTDQAIGTNSLKIVTEASGDAWQLAELILQGETIDLRTTKTATAEVYSTTAFKMLAKVVAPIDASGTGAGPESATSAAHTGSGWETLTFDFASPEDGTGVASDVYGKVLFLPNWEGTGSGTNGDNPNWNNSIAATYYVDNFSGVGYTAPAPSTLTILEDFEGTAPTFSTTSTLVASISTDQAIGTNSLKIVTEASGDAWQQAELILQGETIDLRTTKTATAEVYSTTAFKMLAKVVAPIDASGTGAGPESATSAAHTGSGWETLTFDFASPEDGTGVASDVYGKVLFLPNWEGTGSGTNGDNPNWNNSIAATYYVDNFSGVGYTADGGGGTSEGYCEKVVTHLNIGAAQVASEVKLTVENSGEKTMKVTIESNDADPVDFILIPGDVTGSPTQSAVDTSVAGKMSITLTWEATPPTDVALNILWSKVSTEGNWQLGDAPTTFKFDATCSTASVIDNSLLEISMYPNPASDRLNISAANTIEKVEIFNVLGKKVKSLQVNKNTESISVSDLSSGIYLIRYSVDGKVGTSKFIKE